MGRCQFVAVYPPVLNHIRMGKLAGWRPRGHHERVRESYMMNFAYKQSGSRSPLSSFGRKKEVKVVYFVYSLWSPKRLIGRALMCNRTLKKVICDPCSLKKLKSAERHAKRSDTLPSTFLTFNLEAHPRIAELHWASRLCLCSCSRGNNLEFERPS